MTNDQRMVDMGLLEELDDLMLVMQVGGCTCNTKTPNIEFHAPACKYRRASKAYDKLRAIIDGPGVEPLGYISKNVAEYLATKGPVTAPILLEKEFSDDVALYPAAPSAPVAKCAECGKQAGEGWALYCVECAEKLAPVQAVPDGWQLVPKEHSTEMVQAFYNLHSNCFAEQYSAMLAAAPQPPKESTAQSSAVACPTDKEK